MLVPKTGVGKVCRLVVSAVLLLCIVQPITEWVLPDWSSFNLPSSDESTALDGEVEEQLCAQIEQAVYALCRSRYGDEMPIEKIESVTDISQTAGIYMKHVRVYLNKQKAHEALAIKRYLEQETGLTVEVSLSP